MTLFTPLFSVCHSARPTPPTGCHLIRLVPRFGRSTSTGRALASTLVSVLLLGNLGTALAQTIYVTPTGTGLKNGTSWSDALSGTALQGTLAAATSGTFLVGAGLYTPTTTRDRTISFEIPSGVKVYGGYTGTGPTPNARTSFPSSTTFSGDIGTVSSSGFDNSYNVVRFRNASVATRLDGVVITGGNNSDGNGYGGGIFNDGRGEGNSSNPTLVNLMVINNFASQGGGGMANSGIESFDVPYGNANPVLTNVHFENNSSANGGAMYNLGFASPLLTNVSFVNNFVTGRGQQRGGGAMHNDGVLGNSSPVLINVSFRNNIADQGGAMSNSGFSGICKPILINVSFSSNRANYHGAAIYNFNADVTVTNGVFFGDEGFPFLGGSEPFYNEFNSGTVKVLYSLLEPSATGYISDPTNLTTATSPFADATGGNLQLNVCSRAIDAGNNTAYTSANGPATDLAGNPRFYQNGRIDMGAYEFQGSPSLSQPVVIIQQPASGSAVCAGSSVSVPVSVTGSSPTYQWYKDAQPVSGQTAATLSLTGVQTSQSGSYSLVATGTCNSVTSTAFSLVVNTPPSVSLSNNGPLTCAQTSITLSASATSGSTYTFSGPTGNLTSSGNTASVSSPATYTVTANLNGCTSTTTTTVTSNTAPPSVSISPSATAICAGQSVILIANTSTSGGTLSYRWNTTATSSSISVSATGPYSVTVTRSDNGCVATATANVTVNALPTPAIVVLAPAYCQDAGPQSLSGTPSGGTFRVDSSPATSFNPASFSIGQHTVVYSYTNSNGCSNTATQDVTVKEVPTPPTIVTVSDQPYLAGVSSLTISQNVGNVILSVSGCPNGTISWGGGSATTMAVSTATSGLSTYPATCTRNGCTSPVASFSLTVVLPTLSVLHRDADYGNTQNNIIKPYLELANAGGQDIPYSEVTVRYWFTSEGQAPPTNLAVYYAQLGAVTMNYVPLSQPRQGAFGYVEYSFPSGSSLAGGGNSGPIENGIQKTDGSDFNESDDYSYAANYADYVPNQHITAYRNGTIFYGQEPTVVSSQTAVAVYSQAKDGPTTSQIQTRLELRNTGNVALPVAGLKLRYYFTSDNNQTASVFVDYADIGASNVAAQVVRISPVNGADSYVELSFPGNTMLVNALSNLGSIDFRLVRSDNGLFDQSNDYSYAANYGNVGLNNHITAYLNNSRVFGSEPTGSPRVAASEPGSALSVRVLGNPVTGSAAQVEIRGAEGQAVNLRLVDLQGKPIHEQRIEQAAALEPVSVPLGQSRGTLLLRVNTASQQQVLKLIRP